MYIYIYIYIYSTDIRLRENESVDFEDKIFTTNKSLYKARTISGATPSVIGENHENKTNTKETWPINVNKASSTLLSL